MIERPSIFQSNKGRPRYRADFMSRMIPWNSLIPALIRHRTGAATAIACLLFAATMSKPCFADPGDPLARAQAFLQTLDDTSRAQASAPISAPDRVQWSYLPEPRTGLRLGDLDLDQRSAWSLFMTAALGRDGVARIDRIRATEPIEHRGGGVHTGPDEFRIRFFGLGTVENPPAWSWRIEGHHLSIHQTFIGEEVVCITPLFIGSVVREDVNGEPLGVEDRRAAAILDGLRGDSRRTAMDPRGLPGDLRTAMKAPGRWNLEGGLPLSKADAEARNHANAIVDDLLRLHPEAVAKPLRDAWRRTPSHDITFAWCGDTDRDGPHQWRLVSPVLVVEFSHSGRNVQHGHLVLRTPDGEFPSRALGAWRDTP